MGAGVGEEGGSGGNADERDLVGLASGSDVHAKVPGKSRTGVAPTDRGEGMSPLALNATDPLSNPAKPPFRKAGGAELGGPFIIVRWRGCSGNMDINPDEAECGSTQNSSFAAEISPRESCGRRAFWPKAG